MNSLAEADCQSTNRFMKNSFLSCSRGQSAAQGLLLSLALLAAGSTGAQNYVQNPEFNQPLGPTNWTVKYVGCTSNSDLWIQGRTMMANRDQVPGTWDGTQYFDWYYPTGPCGYGGHFRAYHSGFAHAYFDQVVSGLTPGASYLVTAWMAQYNSGWLTDVQVYLAALGGANMTDENDTPFAQNYTYGNSAEQYGGWQSYAVTSTASTSGQIDVQLHYYKCAWTSVNTPGNIWLNLDGFYDHVSVMPLISTNYPPRILSKTFSNQTASLTWSTTMNDTYDIQVSTNVADPTAWSSFVTNLFATGTNLTYTGAVAANPGMPQFFRVVSYDWVP